MMKWLLHMIPLGLALTLGCSGGGPGGESGSCDTLTHYASALVMVEYPDYISADVRVPWAEGYLARYVVPKTSDATLPEGRVVVNPNDTGAIISFSNVYSAALAEFGAIQRLRGVADAAYLADGDTVRRHVESGRVVDVGSSMAPLIETIIDLAPSIVFASPYATGGAVAQMQQARLPLVLMADYVETDPRGRAEWMQLIGVMTGRRELADSITRRAIARYNALSQLAYSDDRPMPEVITEKPMQGIWYMPGGRSYVARLIADAGATYVWRGDTSAASVPVSLENVLDRGASARFWLIKEAGELTASSLKAQVPQADAFESFSHGVWTCNTLTTTYFNDIALHPDRVLEDYIVIFHPELAGDSLHVNYYTPLK